MNKIASDTKQCWGDSVGVQEICCFSSTDLGQEKNNSNYWCYSPKLMSVFLCMHVCVKIHPYVHIYEGHRSILSVFFCHPPTYFMRQGPSLYPGVSPWVGWLASELLEFACVCACSCLFYMVLRIWTPAHLPTLFTGQRISAVLLGLVLDPSLGLTLGVFTLIPWYYSSSLAFTTFWYKHPIRTECFKISPFLHICPVGGLYVGSYLPQENASLMMAGRGIDL